MEFNTYKKAKEIQDRMNSIRSSVSEIERLLADLEKEPDMIFEIELRAYVKDWGHGAHYKIQGPIQDNEVQPIVPTGKLIAFLHEVKTRMVKLEHGLKKEFERL